MMHNGNTTLSNMWRQNLLGSTRFEQNSSGTVKGLEKPVKQRKVLCRKKHQCINKKTCSQTKSQERTQTIYLFLNFQRSTWHGKTTTAVKILPSLVG